MTKDQLNSVLSRNQVWVILGLFVFAFCIRALFHYTAVMQEPSIRADAAKYLITAINLVNEGAYSYQNTPPLLTSTLLIPGYPWFLSLMYFLVRDIGLAVNLVFFIQLLLGAGTVAFSYMLGRSLMSPLASLAAAILIALYPHQVIVSSYLLTESLFTFTLVSGVYALTRVIQDDSGGWMTAGAILLSYAVLVRPVIILLVPMLLILAWYKIPQARKALGLTSISVGCVYLAWLWWGSQFADLHESNMRAVAAIGSYPDFTYEQFRGFPNREDPQFNASIESWSTLGQYVAQRASKQPLEYITWYAIGKPVSIWEFDLVQGSGGVFVYGVESSLYDHAGLYSLSAALLKLVHKPVSILVLLYCCFVIYSTLFRKRYEISLAELSLVACVFYVSFFHVPLASLPRFSIPFQPFMLILAVILIVRSSTFVLQKRGSV